MHFGSDNQAGAAPRILDAITKAYQGHATAYGSDDYKTRAEARLKGIFECDLTVFFVATGTAANTLALSTLASPWEGIYCHPHAHIHSSESTGPALMTGGASLLPVPGNTLRLTPARFEQHVATETSKGVHDVRPSALSLSQTNELGQVYPLEDIAALCALAKARGLKIHMDGARFTNALVALECSPADMSWRAGVDVLCLGATKCGAVAAEAVIFFDPALARDFGYRVKRSGHLVSKGRLFGAQFLAWLEDGYWLELAGHANQMADRLRTELVRVGGLRLAFPTQGNEVFAIMPKALLASLHRAGATLFEWSPAGLPAEVKVGADEVLVRLVTSFATQDQEIEQLIRLANDI
ncbi:MAG: beta-eliminating lyase-related protein [Parvibaculum sp.]